MVSLVAPFDFSKGLLLMTFRESVYNCCKCPKRNRCRRLVMMVAVVSVFDLGKGKRIIDSNRKTIFHGASLR